MHPPLNSDAEAPSSQDAIVIIAITGDGEVDYIQFCSNNIGGCKNFRFDPVSNDILAFPIKVGTSGLELNSYTIAGKPGGYISVGYMPHSYGFKGADDPKIDISEHGVYLLGTLNPETGKFGSMSSAEIERAKSKYPNLFSSLKVLYQL